MKKLAIAVAASAVMAGSAHAYLIGQGANGFVVPRAYFDANEYTAVGIVNHSAQPVCLLWSFFDQNSTHRADGAIELTGRDFHGFVWNDVSRNGVAGQGLEGMNGYLVFTAVRPAAGAPPEASLCPSVNATVTATGIDDPDAAGAGAGDEYVFAANAVAGNAFQVLPASDVAFVPAISGNINIAAGAPIRNLGRDHLIGVDGAAAIGENVFMRFYLDGGASTRIVTWSTGGQSHWLATGVAPRSLNVNIYGTEQDVRSGQLTLERWELNTVDPANPAQLTNRTQTDGFIQATVAAMTGGTGPAGSTPVAGQGVFAAYSVVNAPAFGAVQTLLATHGF